LGDIGGLLSRKELELGLVGGDVLVPARSVGVLGGIRSPGKGFVDGYISLGGDVSIRMALDQPGNPE